MIKERPILFSTPMVRAILDGSKTVTRRVVKVNIRQECEGNEPYCFSVFDSKWNQYCDSDELPLTLADITNFHKYGQPGDHLWVRETWAPGLSNKEGYAYKATSKWDDFEDGTPSDFDAIKWRPSIHMPKYACRLKLKIVSIRVERLHDITEEDAIREGIQPMLQSGLQLATDGRLYRHYTEHRDGIFGTGLRPKKSFETLWVSINGQESWDSNPWVWRIEFTKL